MQTTVKILSLTDETVTTTNHWQPLYKSTYVRWHPS